MIHDRDWMAQILLRQIEHERPDVLYVFSGVPVDRQILAEARRRVPVLVCQWSCEILADYPYDAYDLIVSSSQSLVDVFRQRGLRAEHLQHAFDERVLGSIRGENRGGGVVFVGSLSPVHARRAVLEELARSVELDV